MVLPGLLVNGKPAAIDLSKSYRWGSGYFLTKFLDDRIDHRKGGTTYMDFPMMRYAEILLDYAEAENEAEDTNTAREKAIAQLTGYVVVPVSRQTYWPQIIIRQPFGNAYAKNAV